MDYCNEYVSPTDVPLKDVTPIIFNEVTKDMISVKELIFVVQTPSSGYAFIPNYVSAGPQTHYAIYKIIEDNKLKLIHQALLIVYDGCSAYLIDKNIDIILKKYGLNNYDIENIKKNKYKFITTN